MGGLNGMKSYQRTFDMLDTILLCVLIQTWQADARHWTGKLPARTLESFS